ncbi:MAG: insulinase family protein, partial [Deltaproteobacteria bacterium]|nr:insulinase family protein [Deltaproteobacteria bacterium]
MQNKEPFSFSKIILENGTEIFYKRIKGKETHIRILLKAGGARYDPVGKEGCAHLLEHLILKKTKNFPNEFLIQRYALENFLEFGASTGLESLILGGGSIDNIE